MRKNNIVLKTLYLLIGSWIFIHLFALFGIFAAFIYFVLWFIIPEKLPCFSCRFKSKRKNSICLFCNEKIVTNNGRYPKSLRSAIKNTAFLVIVALISAFLVMMEAKLLFKLDLMETDQKVIFSIPPRHQYKMGEIFSVDIKIENITEPINAVQVDVAYDPEELEIFDVSFKDSFAKIFLEKSIDNDTGFARISGGLPNPGYFESKGVFGTIYFKGKVAGFSQIEFLPSSIVLANDGEGTNVLSDIDDISLFILPEYLNDEELKNQGAMLTPSVLGTEDHRDPDKLYLYNMPGVLGIDSFSGVNEEKSLLVRMTGIITTPSDLFFSGLKKYDSFVLNNWENVVSIFYVR